MSKKIQVQSQRQFQIDEAILNLKSQLEDSGIFDDELIIGVAKIYANSILISYKKSLDK
jgi:hypothetical protein